MITRRRFAGLLAGAMLALVLAVPGPSETGAARATAFLGELDDVPLMPGLAELKDQGVVFESASGRIVDAAAMGRRNPRLTPRKVRTFYAETLPSLGWTALGGGRFARAGETLAITASVDRGQVLVHFSVRPE